MCTLIHLNTCSNAKRMQVICFVTCDLNYDCITVNPKETDKVLVTLLIAVKIFNQVGCQHTDFPLI